jgi:hypothetical protein
VGHAAHRSDGQSPTARTPYGSVQRTRQAEGARGRGALKRGEERVMRGGYGYGIGGTVVVILLILLVLFLAGVI